MTEADRELLRLAAADVPADRLADLAGVSITRTWQRVNRLISDPAAWEAEPAALLVLRARRDARRRVRPA